MAPPVSTGKVLEVNLISANDLAEVSKSMRTYAVAWVSPERKLTTRVDENGHINPTWNEKFVFRVDDVSLETDTCVITVEIYALTWLRVIMVGTVRALLSSLIPPSTRSRTKPTPMRFITLQVLRPSGRPQGAINVGVALINSTMRSMPLNSDVSASLLLYDGDEMQNQRNNYKQADYNEQQRRQKNDMKIQLWRSQSERTNEFSYNPGSTLCNESMVGGSQIPGSILAGSIISDVGPSASVVAAAIAKGMPYPRNGKFEVESSVLPENWTEKDSTDGVRTKIERWRKEVPPLPDRGSENRKKTGETRRRARQRRHSDGGGLFSCFGNAYGCEFSISCGGGRPKKEKVK